MSLLPLGLAVSYRVSLDIFDGPLDLLLHLIRRRELDVCDVALAEVTESYLQHVEQLRREGGIDLEDVGEFLVVAATLVEIKSAGLLPRPERRRANEEESPEESIDPRVELVRQLLEYKKYKEAAGDLEDLREVASLQYPRVPAKRSDGHEDEPPPLELEEFHAWDLLAIFEKLMDEVGRRGPSSHDVADDETPIRLHAADVADRVRREKRLSLRRMLISCASRREMIGLFLALLELIRQKRVLITPTEGEEDLEIIEAPPEHRATAIEADATFEETDYEPVADES